MEEKTTKPTRWTKFFEEIREFFIELQKLINTTVWIISFGIAAIVVASNFFVLPLLAYRMAMVATILLIVLYGLSFDATDVVKKRELMHAVEDAFHRSELATALTYISMGGDISRNVRSRVVCLLMGGAFFFLASRADFWPTAWMTIVNFFTHLVP